MNILVTGGTGFLGVNLVHRLVNKGHEVNVLVRESSPVRRLPELANTTVGDITDELVVETAMEGVNAVVHLAAVTPNAIDQSDPSHRELLERVNVEGTNVVLEQAQQAGVKRFVFTSTFPAYPPARTEGRSPYVESKIDAGALLSENNWSFESTVLYPTNIMGPRDHDLSIFKRFWVVESNYLIAPPLYQPGSQNIVHTADIVESIEMAINGKISGNHCVCGPNISSRRIHKLISKASDARCWVIPVPYVMTSIVAPPVIKKVCGRVGIDFNPEDVIQKSNSAVPARFENDSPVESSGAEAIITDCFEWYESAGLL